MNNAKFFFYSNRNIYTNQNFREFCFYFLLEREYENTKNHACTNESNNVSLHRRIDTQSARCYYLQGNLVGVRKEPNKKWISLSGAALFGILLFLCYAEKMLTHIG